MKRILFFLMLLVNLQLTTDNGSLSIGFGEVSAQRVQDDHVTEVVTRGSEYKCDCGQVFDNITLYSTHVNQVCTYPVQCSACRQYIERRKLWEHQQYYCPDRDVACPVCHKWTKPKYIDSGQHRCNMPCYCAWCQKRLEDGGACFCRDAVCYGQWKVSESDWINLGYNPNPNPNPGNGGGGIGGGGTSKPKIHKDNVNKEQLTQKWREEGYDREFDPDKCHKCLKAWKLVHQKCGLGEYAGTEYAKNFGPKLEQYGYKCIYSGNSATCPSGYTPQLGDTRVWESHPEQKEPAGHIDWWNGTNWVSDFKENNWYPGKRYKKYKVSYKIYR